MHARGSGGDTVLKHHLLVDLVKDIGFVPTTHLMVHNNLILQFQGFQVPLKVSVDSCGSHVYMHTDPDTYKRKTIFLK